ncbi:transcription antitermination factor NusB [Emcibacter sp. SYSU 3D8]|uniref:transcription antitermination factor NusB n=1 Tax=Emcibacter sp. SYSU 3D8 TaxID=3133969 RepID=UPI0031FF357C
MMVEGTAPKDKGGSRSASRLAAVQALYQLASTDEAIPALVISEFRAWRLGKEMDGEMYDEADEPLFVDIVNGAWERRAVIDGHIGAALTGSRTMDRLERLVLAVLRAGVYEMIARPDVPTAVVINEYMDVAHAFFTGKEPGFVNGVLDNVSRQVRSGPVT